MKRAGCIILGMLVGATTLAFAAGCSGGGTEDGSIVVYNVAVDGGSGAGLYEAGAVCAVEADVPEGKQFMKWIKNGQDVSVNATYAFNVTENSRLIAVFGDAVENSSTEVCYITAMYAVGSGGYFKGENCTVKIPEEDMPREFKGWAKIVDGERGEILSAEKTYTFTVESELTLEPVYGNEFLPVPDNSDNKMFNLNAGQPRIEYDRQITADGTRYSAFTEGVDHIRIYVYTSAADDAEPIGYFKMIQREDGSAYFASVNSDRTWDLDGTPGDYSTPDGNTHNWLKVTIGEMSDGAYSTEKTYYFATQAIGKATEGYSYLDSAISGKGRGVKNM